MEWHRNSDQGETVGTANPLTISVTGPANYYAIFEPDVAAAGILTDTVSYTFDEANGTWKLIPTGDDGEGGVLGYADGINNGTSPFYGNQKIKHVIVQEGIQTLGDYVFEYTNNIQSVSLRLIGDVHYSNGNTHPDDQWVFELTARGS